MAQKENKIQLEIIKFLRNKNILCWRNGNHAVWDAKNNIYRSNPYGMKGVTDIIAVVDGQFIGIEVKTAKGKQSADQVLFQRRLEKAGGTYVLARSVDDVIALGL